MVNDIFRDVHSIKGVAGMLGVTDRTELVHRMETLLNRYREPTMASGNQAVELRINGCDIIKTILAVLRTLASNGQPNADLGDLTTRNQEVEQSPDELMAGTASANAFVPPRTNLEIVTPLPSAEPPLALRVKAQENLRSAEAALFALVQEPAQPPHLHELLCNMHTSKRSAG